MGDRYKQLNIEERERIYALKEQGKSFRKIAGVLGRDHRTIAREYKRNRYAGQEYIPCKAERMSAKRNAEQRTHAPLKNIQIFTYVREKLREEHWSPEIIAGRLPKDHPGESISIETIYQYIYGKGKKYHLEQYLVKGHKKRRVKTGRSVHKSSSRIPDAIMIDKRPAKVTNRMQIGHFETDLREGPRRRKTVLSVTVERKTRYAVISKMTNKKAETKEKALITRLKVLQSLSKSNKPIVRSVTADNGSENTNHTTVSQALGVDMYFCYPYHSWEKGTVENRIGVIRRFIPKGINIYHFTKKQITCLENKLNTTPMKCLNYQTPEEALLKEVNHYKFKRYLKSIWGTST